MLNEKEVIRLADETGLTYENGKNGFSEETDLTYYLVTFARAIWYRAELAERAACKAAYVALENGDLADGHDKVCERHTMRKVELLRAIAGRIRVLRAQRGWSQEVFAELCGLNRNYIGHVERAEVNVGLENLDKLAFGFGLSLRDLLDPEVCDGTH